MHIIPFEHWARLTAPTWLGRIRRWVWQRRHGPLLPSVTGGSADWTPIRGTRYTVDTATEKKSIAGFLVESGAAAGTLDVHDAASAANLIFRFKVDVANTSRLFPMPGMVLFDVGAFLDLDANIASVTVLHG